MSGPTAVTDEQFKYARATAEDQLLIEAVEYIRIQNSFSVFLTRASKAFNKLFIMSSTHNVAATNGKNLTDLEACPSDELKQLRTAGSLVMSPDLFEKLYLSPPNKTTGALRNTFGNPTPMYECFLPKGNIARS